MGRVRGWVFVVGFLSIHKRVAPKKRDGPQAAIAVIVQEAANGQRPSEGMPERHRQGIQRQGISFSQESAAGREGVHPASTFIPVQPGSIPPPPGGRMVIILSSPSKVGLDQKKIWHAALNFFLKGAKK